MTNADILRAAMDAQHMTDNLLRAGTAAIVMGESGMEPRSEVSYAHTSNARIRMIFRRIADIPDDELTALKTDEQAFFNRVYGGSWGARNLGNIEPGDGYKYRGRGFLQLTGRSNYILYGSLCGHPELVDNPDLANQPELAAALAVAYMRDRYKGGGWPGMKAAVGSNTPDIAARKDALFREYRATGEYDAVHHKQVG